MLNLKFWLTQIEQVRDRLQISLVILSELKQINFFSPEAIRKAIVFR